MPSAGERMRSIREPAQRAICDTADGWPPSQPDDEAASVIRDLVTFDGIDDESIFQALSCSHWRHVYLELYRCVESLFYLPWVIDLKGLGKFPGRAVEIKRSCRAGLSWREKGKPSIERLFSIIQPKVLESIEDKIDIIKEAKGNADFKRSAIGSRLYAVRNGLVHHEDHEEPVRINPSDEQWRFLSLLLALGLKDLHQRYGAELATDELVKAA